MAPFTVRPAGPGDAEGMFALYAAVAAEGRWVVGEPPIDETARIASYRQLIGVGWNGVFVAEADGRIVGDLGAVRQGSGPAVIGMEVAADWRGRGVGSALMEACLDWARRSDVHKLSLEVFPWNEAAIALYRKFGFEQEGFLRGQYRRRDGELWNAIVMGLRLD